MEFSHPSLLGVFCQTQAGQRSRLRLDTTVPQHSLRHVIATFFDLVSVFAIISHLKVDESPPV